MGFNIGKGLNLRIGGQSTEGPGLHAGQDDSADASSNLEDNGSNDAALVDVGKEQSLGEPLGVGNIKNALRITAQGIAAIEELRVLQRDIAEKASTTAFGSGTEELTEISQNIQSEIESIAERATASGTSVLQSSALYQHTTNHYSEDGTKISRLGIAAVGDPSSLSAELGSSPLLVADAGSASGYASQEQSALDEDAIDRSLSSLRAFEADVVGAQQQAENFADPPVVQDTRDPPSDFREISRGYSQQIALKLGSPYSKEETTLKLLDLVVEGIGPPESTTLKKV